MSWRMIAQERTVVVETDSFSGGVAPVSTGNHSLRSTPTRESRVLPRNGLASRWEWVGKGWMLNIVPNCLSERELGYDRINLLGQR